MSVGMTGAGSLEGPRRLALFVAAALASSYLLLIAATHAGCPSYFTRPDVIAIFVVGVLCTAVLLFQGLGRWSFGRGLTGAAFGALAGIVFAPSVGALLSAALLAAWLVDRRHQRGGPLDIAAFVVGALGAYGILRVMVPMTPRSLLLGC